MKKINNYSAQFTIIQRSCPPVQIIRMRLKIVKKNPNGVPKKISKQNQEFINNISASDEWIFQTLYLMIKRISLIEYCQI